MNISSIVLYCEYNVSRITHWTKVTQLRAAIENNLTKNSFYINLNNLILLITINNIT